MADTPDDAIADRAAKTPFPPHPGKIVYHHEWDHSDQVKDAGSVPDREKFVYYDASGLETHDKNLAITRVPIVEVTMTKVGNPATVLGITEYGPDHRELRHTTGSVPKSP